MVIHFLCFLKPSKELKFFGCGFRFLFLFFILLKVFLEISEKLKPGEVFWSVKPR